MKVPTQRAKQEPLVQLDQNIREQAMHDTHTTRYIWRAIGVLALALCAACGDDGGSGTTGDTSGADAGDTSGADTGDTTTADSGTNDTSTEDTSTGDTSEAPTEQELIMGVAETGSYEIPGLEEEVQVVYTEMGTPHIYARSRVDMGYALGFLLARDRFFVMDLQRRLALGTLGEVLGDVALPNDVEARLMGMSEVTDLIMENLSEEDAAYMDAYAAGVNTYIDLVAAGELPAPSELVTAGPLLGSSDPSELMLPFDRRSVAAMVTVIVYETNFEGGDPGRELKAQQMEGLFSGEDVPFGELRRAGARKDIWDRLEVLFDVASAPGFGIYEEGVQADGKPQIPRRPIQPDADAVRATPWTVNRTMVTRSADRLDVMHKRLGRKELENFGSNAWAVHGSKTSDGASLVAGDGHLPLSVPSLMFQIGMDTTVFGGGDIAEAGLLITSLPVLAVGTNGKIAWSQVNPVADIVDWYREELILNDDGIPTASMFQGEERPLSAVDEDYVVADIPALGSDGRTETWTRWTTFDGRHIYDIEGVEVDADDPIEPGQTRVRFGDTIIVPQDTDDDGVISALSFDYTAFDIKSYVGTLADFTKAETVYDYQEATKGLIGNMLTAAVSDDRGNILFTPYQAVPCRSYLPRSEEGAWLPGANPTQLIDGTTYGGFTIPSLPDGKVDESQADDPYRCVVPFNATPQSINPPEGFVFNANNQPAPIHSDGSLEDDPWYIGGPWASVRASSIERELTREVEDKSADIAAMSRLHGYRNSRLGEQFVPWLEEAVERAIMLNGIDRILDPHEQRLVDLYNANQARFDEAIARLGTWRERGYDTPSGVVTFYNPEVTEDERADSVATTIFNAWMPRFMGGVFNDENMNPAFRFSGSRMRASALKWFLANRGVADAGIASMSDETGESVFFDVLDTEEVERSDEIMLMALAGALDWLAGDPDGPGAGGFGTTEMDQWIWGLRHQVRFESLLADFLPSDSEFGFLTDLFSITTTTLPLQGEPESNGLKWFPRGGDNWSVDAASPGFSGTRFTYGSGPVMRMVIALKDGEVSGVNIVPGGRSGLTDSPHFADQAALWLGNETVPIRYTPAEVAEGATGREVFKPAE